MKIPIHHRNIFSAQKITVSCYCFKWQLIVTLSTPVIKCYKVWQICTWHVKTFTNICCVWYQTKFLGFININNYELLIYFENKAKMSNFITFQNYRFPSWYIPTPLQYLTFLRAINPQIINPHGLFGLLLLTDVLQSFQTWNLILSPSKDYK